MVIWNVHHVVLLLHLKIWSYLQPEVSRAESNKLSMAKREIHSFSSGAKSKLQYLINSLPVLCLLIILDFAPISLAATVVDSFPGYTGKLPFRLETGYIGVGEDEEIQLFYYFVESERDPKTDPLLLWLTGGPGCSGLSGFLLESGPLNVDLAVSWQTGVPTFKLNPYAWTKVAHIIFIDAPVGTGFSYSKTPQGYYSDDIKASRHNYEFLKKWLQEHSELQENPLYIAGSSYSGIPLPIVVQEILHGNKVGTGPLMNLKGYILGNPVTEGVLSSRYEFAHRVSLLSDELYEVTRESCHGNYEIVDPRNTRCLKNEEAISNDLDPLFADDILLPSCYSPIPPPKGCKGDEVVFLGIWANNLLVRKALHIRKGTKSLWLRCDNTTEYTKNVQSSFSYHQNLTEELLHVLIYSGDQDLVVPYVGTLEWITRLNLPNINRWKPWFSAGQVAGYTSKFSNGHYEMTFATVKGGGHTSHEKPRECFDMFKRWLATQSI